MGANCQITLPHAVKVRDVADVIAACSGVRPGKRYLSHNGDWAAYCPGVEITPNLNEPALANITWVAPEGDTRSVLYHFEWSAQGRGLMPPTTPFWIAVGHRLVEFFGGSIDYNDCEGAGPDFSLPHRDDCWVEDGPEWIAFQERKLAVAPLLPWELELAETTAAPPRQSESAANRP